MLLYTSTLLLAKQICKKCKIIFRRKMLLSSETNLSNLRTFQSLMTPSSALMVAWCVTWPAVRSCTNTVMWSQAITWQKLSIHLSDLNACVTVKYGLGFQNLDCFFDISDLLVCSFAMMAKLNSWMAWPVWWAWSLMADGFVAWFLECSFVLVFRVLHVSPI